MPTARVNGVRLWYETSGKGRPLVQIHGSGLGHTNFAAFTPEISKRYKVIDYDMRGFGSSDKPAGPSSIEVWADDLKGLLEVLGVRRAHVHATSLGAFVGVVFVTKYPEMADSLVLSSASIKYDNAARLRLGIWRDIALSMGMCDSLAELIALFAFSRPYLDSKEGQKNVETMRRTLSKEKAESFAAACDLLLREAFQDKYLDMLPSIKVPVLLLSGELDIMTAVEMGPTGAGVRRMHERIPGLELVLLKGCGHLNLFEQPKQTCDAVVSFLNRVDSGRR